ncbi:FecR family protein [Bosea sp. LjRoot237]|uniref:FecR family protein n=1 Tax=Bosea sp. LjRoot237 TaxID=3342292 RepID=UPI003ECD9550
MSDEGQIEKQAIAWFTRMNGRPSPADREDFARWLGASVAHEQHYANVQRLWTDLGPLSDAVERREAAALASPLQKIEELRRQRSRGKLAAGAVLGLVLCLMTGWLWLERPHLLQDWQADYATARGEQRSLTLADGSTVLLDADSAVAVDLKATERRVELIRGTAFFSVIPGQTPFTVAARNGEARVLGTRFEVAAEDREVSVTLDSGSVEVALRDGAGSLVLKPGESVAYGAAGLGSAHAVDLAEATAWRQGRYIFTNVRLADVLERIGRYRGGRILVTSGALGERRVSGNIALRDGNAALAAVQSTVGFQVTALGRLTLVSP